MAIMFISKKETRNKFRTDVFTRDKYTCQVCGKKWSEKDSDPNLHKLNAHHITDRSLISSGGYVKENGITVCEEPCHMMVEQYHITGTALPNLHPNDLYALIKSSKSLAIKKSEQLA